MGALVFVTTELSPFTTGGIGRVLHNVLKSMAPADAQRAYVLALDCKVRKAEFAAVFPSTRLVTVDSDEDVGRHDMSGHHPPRRAFSSTDFQWKSSVVFRALRTLSRDVEIDYVEFPDWGALGFASVQEKKISGFLSGAKLAVRLHSTHAVLLRHEPYTLRDADCALVDIERKTLRDCDLLIAQLVPVAESMREVFGFDRSEWEPRLVIHAPPVLLDTCSPKTETIAATDAMPIMFGSKLQPVKRPDLFVRGVSAFCHEAPNYSGEVLVSAHSFDGRYSEIVVGLVAPDLVARFHFDLPKHNSAREPLIATCTFIVPSEFESFCLSAYEASLLGARLILNGTNPAFGEGTPWIDGVNCYKFDGTTLGLQKVLKRNFEDRVTMRPVVLRSDPWPWTRHEPPATTPKCSDRPLVSVIIPHFNLGAYLASTLNSVLEQTYDNIEIVLVDDYSTDLVSRALIEDLRSRASVGLKLVAPSGNLGLAAARNLAIRHAAGQYIVPLDADDLLDRRFIEVSVRALECNPDFDVFVTQAAFFRDGQSIVMSGERSDFEDYIVFVGEALVCGLRQNRFSTATACFRCGVLREYGYVESLRSYEDWNLYLRLAQDGCRFLVANDVYFYYRNRRGSMIKETMEQDRRALLVHDNLRTAVNLKKLTPLAYLSFCLGEPKSDRQPPTSPLSIAVASVQKKIEEKIKPLVGRWLERFPPAFTRAQRLYRWFYGK